MSRHINRCLVVGSGSIARRHVLNLQTLLPDAEVGCVSASGRQLHPGDTPAPIRLATFRDALMWKPDLAVVASPAPFHLDHAAALLVTGIAVLIEKPLSDSGARHDALIHKIAPWRGRIEVAYNLRYLSSFGQMRSLLADQTIGRLHSIHIDLGQYLPDWRPQSDYRKQVSARRDLGGGVLLELSHEFDYLIHLFGHFERVYCVTRQSGDLAIDVEDSADVLCSRTDGVIAQLHLDFLQRHPTRRCKVIGAKGNLIWDLIANSIILETSTGRETLFSDSHVDRNDMYLELLRGFIEVSQGRRAPRVRYEDGLAVLRMVDALRLSAESGIPVTLKRE